MHCFQFTGCLFNSWFCTSAVTVAFSHTPIVLFSKKCLVGLACADQLLNSSYFACNLRTFRKFLGNLTSLFPAQFYYSSYAFRYSPALELPVLSWFKSMLGYDLTFQESWRFFFPFQLGYYWDEFETLSANTGCSRGKTLL